MVSRPVSSAKRMPVLTLVLLMFGAASLPPVRQLTGATTDSLDLRISRLDSNLADSPDNHELLLQRGHAHLQAGRFREARADFNAARGSDSSEIIARARLGLGDSFRVQPKRKWEAIGEYRLAIKADSTYRSQALYEIAQTAFELGWTHGNNVAADALTELVSLDPEYKDALTLWWDKIFTQSDGQLRKVCRRLEQLAGQGSKNQELYLNAARIRFRLQQPDSSYAMLVKLKQVDPEFSRSERSLLEANCLIELEDTLGFERCYEESIVFAEQEGEFEHLFREAEAIFRPTEAEKWDSLKTAAEKASFFRVFWTRRDPDPTTPHNERLLTHYKRLHEAKNKYFDLLPHGLSNTSYEYFRLTAIPNVDASNISPYFYLIADYDHDMWWDRCRPLALQHRGLFFIRHGEPDMEYRFGLPWDAELEPPSYEAWRYGSQYYCFNRMSGTYGAIDGKGNLIPFKEMGDITKAMKTESYKDPLPSLRMANYGVEFKRADGSQEAEFYQSLPVSLDTVALEVRSATVVIYDNQWRELQRRDVTPQKVFTGRDSMWVAVNSVPVKPGPMFCALKMDVPGYRAVVRRPLNPWPFSDDKLELSGLILGSPPPEGVNVHSRGTVKILPRPSLVFRHGEIITVYLEIYGLGAGGNGEREKHAFSEQVTVTLEEPVEDENIIHRIFGRKKPRTSMTLNFERYPQAAGSRVAEYFTVDTSELVPGRYGLTLRVRDKHDAKTAAVAVKFNLRE